MAVSMDRPQIQRSRQKALEFDLLSTPSYKPEEYWENLAHDQLKQAGDPALLGAVCYAGAPLWLNNFFAHIQRNAVTGALRQVVRDGRGGVALEIGCGSGRWCHYLSTSGEVVGVDIAPSMVRRAREIGGGPQFCLGMAQALPFAENTFELALSITVLMHVPDELKSACVKELVRVLRPGGTAILYERISPALGAQVHPIAIDGWVRLFSEHGMRMNRCVTYEYAPLLRLLHRASMMLPARARTSGLASDQVKRPADGRAPMTAASISRLPLPARLAARLAVALSYPVEHVSHWLLGSRLASSALMVFDKT